MSRSLQQALTESFETYRDSVWGACYRMTRTVQDADDMTQETFLRLRERPPEDLERPLKSWLLTVAANLCRDQLRRRKQTTYVGQWLPAPASFDESTTWFVTEGRTLEQDSPDARLFRLESVSFAFLLALEELSPNQRCVLLLRDVYEFSVEETARALELTTSNVKTTHHRARKALDGLERTIPDEAARQVSGEVMGKLMQCLMAGDFDGLEELFRETLEVDLHWSRDDELIIWHDPVISAGLCDLGPGDEERPVRSLTAEELSGFRCDRNPDAERFPDQTTEPTALAGDDFSIITLSRLLDFVEEYAMSPEKSEAQRQNARKVRFNIETKREPAHPEFIGDGFDGESPGPFERALVALIAARGLKERATMQSFDHRSLWAARQIAEWLPLVVLDREIETPFEEFVEKGATIWSPRARLVTAQTLQAAHAAGLKAIPWTVNDPNEMERLIALGVDGIITDRPDLLVVYR